MFAARLAAGVLTAFSASPLNTVLTRGLATVLALSTVPVFAVPDLRVSVPTFELRPLSRQRHITLCTRGKISRISGSQFRAIRQVNLDSNPLESFICGVGNRALEGLRFRVVGEYEMGTIAHGVVGLV